MFHYLAIQAKTEAERKIQCYFVSDRKLLNNKMDKGFSEIYYLNFSLIFIVKCKRKKKRLNTPGRSSISVIYLHNRWLQIQESIIYTAAQLQTKTDCILQQRKHKNLRQIFKQSHRMHYKMDNAIFLHLVWNQDKYRAHPYGTVLNSRGL